MNRFVVCYQDLRDNSVEVAPKQDFKEIRTMGGYDNFKVLEEKLCATKKQEKEFEEYCKDKYKRK
jgi:proteasome assembly chaperone (PAC2) family protein